MQIASQVGLQLFSLICKFVTVSAELRRLKGNLEQLTRIIGQIQDLSQACQETILPGDKETVFLTIYEVLGEFMKYADALEKIIDEPSKQ